MSEELDLAVLNYLLDERAEGRPVFNGDLMSKAREVAHGIEGIDPNFKASTGWLKRWKKRNHIGIRKGTNEAQKLPEDYAQQIKDFVQQIRRKRLQNDYTDHNIGNMDQTQCRFDMPAAWTNDVRGDREVRIAGGPGVKKGFTVALSGRADGTKSPAYIVLKEPTGRIPPRTFRLLTIPRNVKVVATRNGWMTGPTMVDWVRQVWGANDDDVRRLVILDQARIHTMQTTKDTLDAHDTDVVYVPAGCTSLVQPADVSWNRPFKAAMRRNWAEWRRRGLRTPAGNLQVMTLLFIRFIFNCIFIFKYMLVTIYTYLFEYLPPTDTYHIPLFFLFQMASRQEVINWVSRAWDEVDGQVISRSFKACGISSDLDGSEDGLLNDRMSDALNAADREDRDAMAEEALELLFDDEGNDSDLDFDGFSDEEAQDAHSDNSEDPN